MLWGMLLMALAFWMYAIAVALARLRSIILERERQNEWGAACSGIAWENSSPMGGYAVYVWGSVGACAARCCVRAPGCLRRGHRRVAALAAPAARRRPAASGRPSRWRAPDEAAHPPARLIILGGVRLVGVASALVSTHSTATSRFSSRRPRSTPARRRRSAPSASAGW
jgi:heme exporter protein D